MVYDDSRYKVLITSASNLPYVLINKYGQYSNHSHFSNLKGAKRCIKFLRAKQKPSYSLFMQEAVKRIAGDDYQNFSEQRKKDRYVNRR